METQKKKCSLDEHREIDSKTICIKCNIYMCNKCDALHSKLFPNHTIFNSEKNVNEIFTGICKEKGHMNKLQFFCKTHNQLCCVACIAKIQEDNIGLHKDCNICTLKEIKDEKKNNINENINYLNELSKTLDKSVEKLINAFENINKSKEELKTKIQNIFTKIRNELNNREDKLLSEVDDKFNNLYFNENIVKNNQKLPEKIKELIKTAENANKEYDDNKIDAFINICINIENSIKNIKKINDDIIKCQNFDNKQIKFIPENEELIKEFLEKIKNFGELKNISLEFVEIENPWTIERFKNNKNFFYYTLKENNYIAEKTENNNYIHSIKAMNQLQKNKIYKLEFLPNYKANDFGIGFGDFSVTINNSALYSAQNSVCLKNNGLFINSQNINENIKLENGKKYEFIIDIKNKKFSLFTNDENFGEYEFNFQDNIFAQASIRNVGNSIKIKTYEKDNE